MDSSFKSIDVDSISTDKESQQSKEKIQILKYPSGLPVIFMDYPSECQDTKDSSQHEQVVSWEKYKPYTVLYKVYANVPACIILAFERNSCVRTKSYSGASVIWKLMTVEKMRPFIKKLRPNQRYNHFPCTWELGRKDRLTVNINRMRKLFDKEYDFMPVTYTLPGEAAEAAAHVKKSKGNWIVKPVASSRGRGVHMLKDKDNLPSKGLLSKYVGNPHLINNKKYDLRLYVLVSSFTPLKIYLYEEGLVRFASEEYTTDPKSLGNKYVHLTNYAVNKKNENYNKNTAFDEAGEGSKWALGAFREHLLSEGVDVEQLFDKIGDVIVKTILSIADETVDRIIKLTDTRDTMFEVYGFDVLIDNKLKPWLVEVNLNPSLSCGSELDLRVKTMMITDSLSTVGLVPHKKDNPKKTVFMPDREATSLESLKREEKRAGKYKLLFPKAESLEYYRQFVQDLGRENEDLWIRILKDKS